MDLRSGAAFWPLDDRPIRRWPPIRGDQAVGDSSAFSRRPWLGLGSSRRHGNGITILTSAADPIRVAWLGRRHPDAHILSFDR